MDPFALIPLGVGATIGAVALYRLHQERERFFRAADLDEDVEPWRVAAHPFALSIRADARCTIGSVGGSLIGGRSKQPPLWHVVLDVDHPFAARTHFSIARENALTRLAKKAGHRDVEIGDRAFDDTYAVKADDPAALRGVLADVAVMQALLQLVEEPHFASLALDHRGALRAKLHRPHTDFVDARRLLLTCSALSRALGDARDRPSVRDPSPLLLTGASSTHGGSSVAIPLHLTEDRR